MNTQPEALRLADALEAYDICASVEAMPDLDVVAAELRRLQALNADLLEALKGAIAHWPVPSTICKDRAAWVTARAAIAKATGEQA